MANKNLTKMRDTALGNNLMSTVERLRMMIDHIGPTPLRHALDMKVTDMRNMLLKFDQKQYEEIEGSNGGLDRGVFVAMHRTEPGFPSVAKAAEWIEKTGRAKEWQIAQVTTELSLEACEETADRDKSRHEMAVRAAVLLEHERISKVLGLGVYPCKK